VGPWVEYWRPDDMFPQHDAAPPPRRARRLISTETDDAFFVYGEWDDGNGMWMITGVSP